MTVEVDDVVKKDLIGKGGKKAWRAELPVEESDEIDEMMKKMGFDSRAQFLRESVMSMQKMIEKDEERQAKSGMELPKGGLLPQHHVNDETPMAKMAQMMEQMAYMKMLERFMSDGGSGGGGQSFDKEEMRWQMWQEDRAEQRRLQREDAQMRMMMYQQQQKGGGGDPLILQMLQAQKESAEAAERRFQEYLMKQDADRREESFQQMLQQQAEENKYLQQRLAEQAENHAMQLMSVKDDLNARMEERVRDMRGAREQTDEFTQTLEVYDKVNNMVENIAPNLGFRKSRPIDVLEQGMGRRAAPMAAPPEPPKAGVTDYMNLGLAILTEVKELIQAGGQLGQAAGMQQAMPQGAPPIPMGAPIPGADAGKAAAEMRATKVVATPGDASEIDPNLVGMTTDLGVPITDEALKEMTRRMRSPQSAQPLNICDQHGTIEPCELCEEQEIVEVKECDLCGQLMDDGTCPTCLEALYSFIPKYTPLINQLHENQVDITPIVQLVDKARVAAEATEYKKAALLLEQAAKDTTEELEKLEPAVEEEPQPEPERITNDGVDMPHPDILDLPYQEQIARLNRGEPIGVVTKKYEQADQLYEAPPVTPLPKPQIIPPEGTATFQDNGYYAVVQPQPQPQPEPKQDKMSSAARARQQVDDKLTFWGEEIAKIAAEGIVDIREEVELYNSAVRDLDDFDLKGALKKGEMAAIYATAKRRNALEQQRLEASKPKPIAPPQPEPTPTFEEFTGTNADTNATMEITPYEGDYCTECGNGVPKGVTVCANCFKPKTREELTPQEQEAVQQIATNIAVGEAVDKLEEMIAVDSSQGDRLQDAVNQLNPKEAFPLYEGVEVPDGNGPIVGLDTGGYGRVIDEKDGALFVQIPTGNKIAVTTDNLRPGVCTLCGRDCGTKGARTVHERACERKYKEYMK